MFYICNELVGGQGTQCDTSSVKDATYARVDGLNGQPGYFTANSISYYITPGLDDYTGHTGLTAEQALPNIDSALARISGEGLGGTPYILKINGGITGQFAIGDSLNGKAVRIVLEGVTGNTADSLYGGKSGTVLTVATAVPVEIRNLKITGGKAENGGGISIASGATVTLADGALISGNRTIDGSNHEGGGVYNAGTLFMYGSAIVGNDTATKAPVDRNVCANAADHGGGLYNAAGAKAYLGYSSESTLAELTGGFYGNYGWGEAGAIYNLGTLKMSSGNIFYNGSVGYTAGVTNDYEGVFEMTGGTISYNVTTADNQQAVLNSGGVRAATGQFIMQGGEISYNSSNRGGGVYVTGTATITGGLIKSNTANQGGGIYFEGGTLNMGGGVVVEEDNDIYLPDNKKITVVSSFDNMYAGTITPQSYPESYTTELVTFTFASGVDGNQCVKFKVTPEQRSGKTYHWYTNDYGKINKNQCRINVPNDAAHPYVLTQDSEYKISSTVAYHPEVYITQDVLDATTSLSYYVTLSGYKRVSPSNNSSFNMYNKNSGVKFYYHITLEGTNSIENSNRAPLLFGGVGDAELIFDATTTTGGTLSLSVTDVSNKVLYFESGAGNLTFKVADGCTFTGTVNGTTYSDITAFFNAAKNSTSASFTVKRNN